LTHSVLLKCLIQFQVFSSADEKVLQRKRPLEVEDSVSCDEETVVEEAPKKKKKAQKKKSASNNAGWSVTSVDQNQDVDMSAWKNLFVPEPVLKAL